MTHPQDDAAEKTTDEALVLARDEALARAKALEAELEELRAWLRRHRQKQTSVARLVPWAGYGCLGGSGFGALLAVATGNPFIVPLATLLGAILVGGGALSIANEHDGFPDAPWPR